MKQDGAGRPFESTDACPLPFLERERGKFIIYLKIIIYHFIIIYHLSKFIIYHLSFLLLLFIKNYHLLFIMFFIIYHLQFIYSFIYVFRGWGLKLGCVVCGFVEQCTHLWRLDRGEATAAGATQTSPSHADAKLSKSLLKAGWRAVQASSSLLSLQVLKGP